MPTSSAQHLIYYDSQRRRLWIAGQRCHHGATGALLTSVAAAGIVGAKRLAAYRPPVAPPQPPQMRIGRMLALAAAGCALMADDWHDREIWFQRGWQNQP